MRADELKRGMIVRVKAPADPSTWTPEGREWIGREVVVTGRRGALYGMGPYVECEAPWAEGKILAVPRDCIELVLEDPFCTPCGGFRSHRLGCPTRKGSFITHQEAEKLLADYKSWRSP